MDKIIRCITSDGAVMVSAIDSTDIAYKASVIHHTSPVASAALGRLLSAASMMGAQLKSSKSTLNIRFEGDGELGAFMAVADSNGNVKGFVTNPDCPTTHYENGKLNVARAVGAGIISVMKDFGEGEPYIGKIPIVSGEIAEDITNYYATSEQIPTVCALGVLIDKDSSQVLLSGGLLIQLLPGADDSTIDKIEENVAKLDSVTTMLAKGLSALDMCKQALDGFEVEVLDEFEVKYVCGCSKEKIRALIASMPKEEIRSMIDENHGAEANCRFCNKRYTFTENELEELLKKK
ncbi:Hsp33 family molecular chaperone HslO [Ruminococcus sp.]|uniref:Hsp33 family molecular chaperone HslO n=1 Tax=Ruminococcus sp. TaxID=41978 RepID=UPI00386AE1B1